MAGTVEGGKRAAFSNKKKYGADFYARIGAIGGKNGTTGGFGAHIVHKCKVMAGEHKISQCAGKIGGIRSRRLSHRD